MYSEDKSPPQRILVFGGTGFIGRHLVPVLLQSDGIAVSVLTRQRLVSASPTTRVEYVQGDIADQHALHTILEPGATLVNLAWSNTSSLHDAVTNAAKLVEACAKSGITRLIHCSSISVYGRVRGVVTEQTQCSPRDEYGRIKLAVEQTLLDRTQGRFELIILRPSEVFGVGGQSLISLMNSLLMRNWIVNYFRSSLFGQRQTHFVPVETVADAIRFFCTDKRKYYVETFIVSADDDPLNNFSDIESLLIEELNLPAYPFPPLTLPRILLESILLSAGRPTVDSQVLYSSKKLKEWGFQSNHSLEHALREFAKIYNNQIVSGITD